MSFTLIILRMTAKANAKQKPTQTHKLEQLKRATILCI